MNDYITCQYCGVVKRGHICPYKPARKAKAKDSKADKFRKSTRWTKKSIQIRQRDKYLCQVCINNKYQTIDILNYNNLEVHHIVPVEEDYNKRLDDNNLITLCHYHHKLAEKGEIPKEYLQGLVNAKYEG